MRHWTPRQLRTALGWLDRQWNAPSRADFYLMALAERLSPLLGPMLPLEFGREPAQASTAQDTKRSAAQQKAKDKADSDLWRGIVKALSDPRVQRRGGPPSARPE